MIHKKREKLAIFVLLGIFFGMEIILNDSILVRAGGSGSGSLRIPGSNLAGTNTSESSSRYNAGQYKVGTDIPAGEYVVFSSSSSTPGYFCVSYDSNDDNIIFNDNFSYNSIITVEDGEYLTLNRCYAIPMDDNPEVHITGAGMFKVGLHIPAGEYRLDSGNDMGYYCVYSSSRQQSIVSNNNFEGQNYVTVSDGQYLELKRCKILDPPDTTTIEPTYSETDTVMKVQEALNNAGYECGTADGIVGSNTQSAIQQYQEDNRLTISGTIDEELLESLGLNDSAKDSGTTTSSGSIQENGSVAQYYEKDYLGDEYNEMETDLLENDSMLAQEITLRLYCLGKPKEMVEDFIDLDSAKISFDATGTSYTFEDANISVYYDDVVGDGSETWHFDNEDNLEWVCVNFEHASDPNCLECVRCLEETIGSSEQVSDFETGISHYYWSPVESTEIIEYYNFIGSDSSKDDGEMELTIEYCKKE